MAVERHPGRGWSQPAGNWPGGAWGVHISLPPRHAPTKTIKEKRDFTHLMPGSAVQFALRLAAVLLALALVVEMLSYSTFALSGAGDLDLSELEAIQAPQRHPAGPKALNEVAEWPADKGRNFTQAPYWNPMVAAGTLPAVEERLPQDPLVIVPTDQLGPYGGTWTRFGTGPGDVGIFGARLCYEALVRWDPMARGVRPNLATSWKVDDGGRTFTFHLRRGVRWSDGHPFSADDIVFWYEDVLQNPDLTPVIDQELKRGGELMQLEKLDDYTVRVRFEEPHNLFLKMVASDHGQGRVSVMYPAHYLKQFHPRYVPPDRLQKIARQENKDFWYQVFEDKFDYRNVDAPRLWAWVMDQPPPARPAVFSRNPYYWKVDPDGRQLPYIDQVSFEIYDVETINLKAINGEVGMQGRHISFQNYPLFMSNAGKGGYRVLHWIDDGDDMVGFAFNLHHKDPVIKEIFLDRRFRFAMSQAIDRDAINEIVYLGVGQPRQIAPSPLSPFYEPENTRAHLEFDPRKANRLLDEMGLQARNEDGIRLRPDGKPLVLAAGDLLGHGRQYQCTPHGGRQLDRGGSENQGQTACPPALRAPPRSPAQRRGELGGGRRHAPPDRKRLVRACPQRIVFSRVCKMGAHKAVSAAKNPLPVMMRSLELFEQLQRTADQAEQIRIFREILELARQDLWFTGIVGDIPRIFIVNDSFRNVPEVAVATWTLRTPGATAPEAYAIAEN